MNVYMSGPHGCGKSTTAKIVAEKSGLGLLPSASRSSQHKQGTVEHQDYVMDQVYKRCATYDVVVHERTPFDAYAYTEVAGLDQLLEKHQMKMDAFARSMKNQGDILFYFPITFPLYQDGVRPDEKTQAAVDDIMRSHIERTEVPCLMVPGGTPEDRADFILSSIEKVI